MIELKNCPFCGGTPTVFTDDDESTVITCICGAKNWSWKSRKAIEKWNRRASGWIPVGERLPEYDVPVLVVSAFDDYTVAMKWEGLGDDDWRFVDCRELMTLIGITHWQPLPEPPV